MVSTRQMSTTFVNNNGLSSIGGASTSVNAAAGAGFVVDENTTRYTVNTRASQQLQQMPLAPPTATTPLTNYTPVLAGASARQNGPVVLQLVKAATEVADDSNNSSKIQLFDLPTEILMNILSYTNYKTISQCRLVSSKMNDICMSMLNTTFAKLISKTYNRFHAIKSNMPRRESARRNHPLACECDVIETCYMRLSLLQMTLGKHIERGYCCFFPGLILDEVYYILRYISATPLLQRPFRITDELFDLSTMAMEYFRDRIEPTLPGIAYFNKDFYNLPTNNTRPSALVISSDLSDSPTNSPPQNHMVLRKGIRKIKQGMKIYNNQLSVLRTDLRNCKRKSLEQGKQITEQQKMLAEMQKQTLEYATRLDENDKKNEEMSRKFSTLLQELNKCKTELQFWRSKSPALPICMLCNQKMTPILPPEDLQALVNQGVNPENIINNLNADDADTESDVNIHENQLTFENEFVFPDEATTAKLLAINMATKNLKRKYLTNTIITGTETITTITSTTTSNGNTYNQNYDTTTATTSARAAITAAATAAAAQVTNTGYSTKLFYGNQNINQQLNQTQQRGGVIVSPNSLSSITNKSTTVITAGVAATATGIVTTSATATVIDGGIIDTTSKNANGAAPNNIAVVAEGVTAAGGVNDSVAAAGSDNDNEVLHETKKARRVQKSTRCVNSNGKRSK